MQHERLTFIDHQRLHNISRLFRVAHVDIGIAVVLKDAEFAAEAQIERTRTQLSRQVGGGIDPDARFRQQTFDVAVGEDHGDGGLAFLWKTAIIGLPNVWRNCRT